MEPKRVLRVFYAKLASPNILVVRVALSDNIRKLDVLFEGNVSKTVIGIPVVGLQIPTPCVGDFEDS